MSLLISSIFLLCIVTLVSGGGYPKGVPRPDPATLKHGAKYSGASALPSPHHDIASLPSSYDWCDRGDQQSLCTASWNQHIPQYCGSCYLHGTLSSVQDRIKIAKGGRGTDVMLARQVILNCGHYRGGFGSGCNGGSPYDILEYMHRFGLPSETCQTYKAQVDKCTEESICHNCMPVGEDIKDTVCWAVKNFTTYRVKEYGRVHGEAAIMSEVFARGPVVCGMATTHEFDYNYTGGVFIDTSNAKDVNHDVEIVGWGETHDGIKYWNVRNSWGTYWGRDGFFKLLRGSNNLRIEDDCVFALVDISDEYRSQSGEYIGSMYGRINKPKLAQKQDRDAIRYGPLPENKVSIADQLEDQEEREARKAAKAAKKNVGHMANIEQPLPTLMTPNTLENNAGISSGVIVVMCMIGLSGMAALIYRKAKQADGYQLIQ